MTRYTGTLLGDGIESNLRYWVDPTQTLGRTVAPHPNETRTTEESLGRYPEAIGSETECETP
ncbi:hypothetical protein [Halococcus sp. AFM35]|uniref:hypothetical protein n=1 Tax=Halococcus sp. AFM35 TaxID=3421653 RepID=UPI003EBDA03A